jgi:quercetin dioxygenase-like cupin family protein
MATHEFSKEPTRDRWFLGTHMHFHATAKDSGGAVTVVEQTMAEGFSPPRHVHAHESAVIVVLEGALTVEIGGEQRKVHASESVFLPRGIPHTFRADAPARILEVTTPGGIDTFYSENGVPAEHGGLPEPAAPDLQRLTASARRRDIEILGPPLDG